MRVGTFAAGSEYANTPEGLHLKDDRSGFLVGGVVPISDDRVREMVERGAMQWDSPELGAAAMSRLRGEIPVAPPATQGTPVPVAAVPRKTNRTGLKVAIAAAAVLVLAGVAFGGWKAYQVSQLRSAIKGAQLAAKLTGEALVAGDVDAFKANTISTTPLALFTTAELAPQLMGETDQELVQRFEQNLLKNRVMENIGQNLIKATTSDDLWIVSNKGKVVWFPADSGDGKKALVIFQKDGGKWKLAYWTPPLTDEQAGEFGAVVNRGEGPLNGLPGVAEALALAGIKYDRTTSYAKDTMNGDGTSDPSAPATSDSQDSAPAQQSSGNLSEKSIKYAEQLGGKSHKGETLYFIIGASGSPESFMQHKLDQALPLFGDMQPYFIVQSTDNFDGLTPGMWFVGEAYATKADAEENLDFAKRGFEDDKNSPYIKQAVVKTDDPIPVNYVDVNPKN